MTPLLFPCAPPGLALLLNAHLGRCFFPQRAPPRAPGCLPGRKGPSGAQSPSRELKGTRGCGTEPSPGPEEEGARSGAVPGSPAASEGSPALPPLP